MRYSKLLALFKMKMVVLVVTILLVVGSATVVLAAPLASQNSANAFAHATATASATSDDQTDRDQDDDKDSGDEGKNCFTQDHMQELLTRFHLSSGSSSTGMKALCALHAGTFTGMTPSGTSVAPHHAYTSQDIEHLLTLAQFLATKDKVTLSEANISNYLALAVNTCTSSASTTDCLKHTIPGFHSGDHEDQSHD